MAERYRRFVLSMERFGGYCSCITDLVRHAFGLRAGLFQGFRPADT